jgi:hypothetical protein
VISVCNNKISSIASSTFLELVKRVTTTWTTGGRVGVLFTSPLKHRGIRYSTLHQTQDKQQQQSTGPKLVSNKKTLIRHPNSLLTTDSSTSTTPWNKTVSMIAAIQHIQQRRFQPTLTNPGFSNNNATIQHSDRPKLRIFYAQDVLVDFKLNFNSHKITLIIRCFNGL